MKKHGGRMVFANENLTCIFLNLKFKVKRIPVLFRTIILKNKTAANPTPFKNFYFSIVEESYFSIYPCPD